MELSLFDLHCDTAYEMLKQKQPLADNSLAVSLKKAEGFRRYVQVMALWTDHRIGDEDGWLQYLAMRSNLLGDSALQTGAARIVTRYPEADEKSPTLILAVEDARILAEKIERVDLLYSHGIRILTPLWKGVTCIGGSHDTDTGLTIFGKRALARAAELGMILDLSHASRASANDMLEIAACYSRPVVATHSDAYAVCPVSRNLRDEQVLAILRSGGVIGLNLYGAFLKADGNATAEDLIPHIEHFLSLGGEDALCLGCDMDGCDLPPDVPDLSALPRLAELLQERNYPDRLIQKIFFENADRFAKQYFI